MSIEIIFRFLHAQRQKHNPRQDVALDMVYVGIKLKYGDILTQGVNVGLSS